MRVIEIPAYGPPEVLRLAERPDPAAGPGEVVVAIAAASVNAADWKIRTGASVHGATLPHVPGRDFAGTVIAAGQGADLPIGTDVFGVCPPETEGAYAERIAISANHVAAMPAGLTFVQAAACALAGLTAMVGLAECLQVRPGERVLVQGGAGGVGSMAVQLARHLGARVAATARAENHDYLRGLGAEQVVDYRTADLVAALDGMDAVFDCVGPATLASTFSVLRPGGRAAFIGMGRHAPPSPRPDTLSLKPDVRRDRGRLDRLAALLASGAMRPPQIRTLPLGQAAQAHRQSEAGHVRGKLVLVTG